MNVKSERHMGITSESSVVDDHEHDEGGVKDGEGDEQLVEGVAHLLPRENGHREQVPSNTHRSNNWHQNSLKLHSSN